MERRPPHRTVALTALADVYFRPIALRGER